MILQSLYSLYDRLKEDRRYSVAPPGFSLQKITFKVVLKLDGTLFQIQDVRVRTGSRMRPLQLLVPGDTKSPGSGLNPCFLWDNTVYMLGFKPDDDKPARTKNAFNAFRQKHLNLENEINDPNFSAVCRFLKNWNPDDERALSEKLEDVATGFGVFQILGQAQYVHEVTRIQEWWKDHAGSAEGFIAPCLLTGKPSIIARVHPKIRGVRNAQSTAAIVSFNERSYESYGKEQSFNAPVSEDAAFRYTTALNALLDGPLKEKHRLWIGDATVAFWTDKPTFTEDIFALFTSKGSSPIEGTDEVQDESLRERLEVFLKALRQGQQAYRELEDSPDRTSFYLLGLSPNAARISIRFFYCNSLTDLFENLRRHFSDISIHRQFGKETNKPDPQFPAVWMFLRETARDSKDIPPILAGPLLRAIVTGCPYPGGLYSAVIRRIHADRNINYLRACVIKGYLTRNLKQEVSMSLDTKRTEPAYRLGRLFAALEKTQTDALGHQIGATIRDRFYSSASATPRSVFPRLLRTYQHHLSKMENYKINREKLVQEILDPLADFPAQLNLADQGLFAIGYYHQMRAFFTKKDNLESSLANQAPAAKREKEGQ